MARMRARARRLVQSPSQPPSQSPRVRVGQSPRGERKLRELLEWERGRGQQGGLGATGGEREM